MMKKLCVAGSCTRHAMHGVLVAPERYVWACSVHKSLLPVPMFHVKLETPTAPQLSNPESPALRELVVRTKQGSLF
jgi:hypothetical protein